MAYTLVRHNCWMVPDFPRFARGLEPCRVSPGVARVISLLGGVLFESLDDALDAADGFMYPTGDPSITADPAGHFRELPFLKLPLFVPEFSGDLLAA